MVLVIQKAKGRGGEKVFSKRVEEARSLFFANFWENEVFL